MPPLFQQGSPDDLARAIRQPPAVLSPAADAAPTFAVSSDRRGIALKSIRLTQEFGFFQELFNPAINVYFIAWAWDFSGSPVLQYPPAQLGAAPDGFVIRLRNQSERRFIGDGVMLFAPRTVTAGINLCIQLWKSTQDVRALGATLASVTQTIQASELSQLLSVAALATATPAALIAQATSAALQLSGAVGAVLKTSGDEQLDLFQGTYGVTQPWQVGDDTYQSQGATIVLSRLS